MLFELLYKVFKKKVDKIIVKYKLISININISII